MSDIIRHNDRLKGPDLDVFEVGPGGEKRPLPSPAQEAAAFEAGLSGSDKQAIIDEFMGSDVSNNQQTHDGDHVPFEEQERMARAAYKLMKEFPDALAKQLSPLGFKVKGMLPSGEGDGYMVYCVDRDNREFNVKMGHDDTTKAFYEYGDSMGVRLVSVVVERLVAARKRYFDRMGGAEKVSRIIV